MHEKHQDNSIEMQISQLLGLLSEEVQKVEDNVLAM